MATEAATAPAAKSGRAHTSSANRRSVAAAVPVVTRWAGCVKCPLADRSRPTSPRNVARSRWKSRLKYRPISLFATTSSLSDSQTTDVELVARPFTSHAAIEQSRHCRSNTSGFTGRGSGPMSSRRIAPSLNTLSASGGITKEIKRPFNRTVVFRNDLTARSVTPSASAKWSRLLPIWPELRQRRRTASHCVVADWVVTRNE